MDPTGEGTREVVEDDGETAFAIDAGPVRRRWWHVEEPWRARRSRDPLEAYLPDETGVARALIGTSALSPWVKGVDKGWLTVVPVICGIVLAVVSAKVAPPKTD